MAQKHWPTTRCTDQTEKRFEGVDENLSKTADPYSDNRSRMEKDAMLTGKKTSLGRHLYTTALAVNRVLENKYKHFDLTLEQTEVLRQLCCHQGISASALSAITAKSPANMTRIIDRLERKNLVSRSKNPKDRRATKIGLTTTGQRVIQDVIAKTGEYEELMISGISESDLVAIQRGLRQLKENMVLL